MSEKELAFLIALIGWKGQSSKPALLFRTVAWSMQFLVAQQHTFFRERSFRPKNRRIFLEN